MVCASRDVERRRRECAEFMSWEKKCIREERPLPVHPSSYSRVRGRIIWGNLFRNIAGGLPESFFPSSAAP